MDFDVTLNGTSARVARQVPGWEQATFRPFFRRQEGNNDAPFKSNSIRRATRQGDWSAGATWWRPSLNLEGEERSYFRAHQMDAFSRPGQVVPMGDLALATTVGVLATSTTDGPTKFLEKASSVFFISTDTQAGPLARWGVRNNAGAYTTTNNSTAGSKTNSFSIVYNPVTDYFYTLSSTHISRFKTDGTENNDWVAVTPSAGAALVITPYGDLWYWTGTKLQELDQTAGTLSDVTDDGLGVDYLTNFGSTANALAKQDINLAVSTPEGVYYCKNVQTQGFIQPWIFRVEKNNAGEIISSPIATLSPGTIVLQMASFLDSIVLAYTSQTALLLTNAHATPYPVTLYHISGENKGVIGTIEDQDALSEIAVRFLGCDDKYLYIGGGGNLWVYDGVRGGLHPIYRSTAPSFGGWRGRAANIASKLVFWQNNKEYQQATSPFVGSLGDTTHHWLESNPFNFDLPFERKTLTKIMLKSDSMAAGQQYEVWVSVDGGNYAQALVHSGASTFVSETTTSISGFDFSYKLFYSQTASDTTPPAVRDVLFEASAGKMIRGWEMILDGTSMVNLRNQPQDMAAFYSAMLTLGALETPFTFTHSMTGYLEQDNEVAYTVKVQEVEIMKSTATEQYVRLLVSEA